ncbi:MAG: tyrosine-type recombinase/integrase [Candidatus Omnitrophica bacterium]|nr:tyrosine-type recombinase/integrase [Candidatus Omnitrophota bacterium]
MVFIIISCFILFINIFRKSRQQQIKRRSSGEDNKTSLYCLLYFSLYFFIIDKKDARHLFFATHLLLNGINIREIQELLELKHVETTMIYTHAIRNLSNAPESPLDGLYRQS